VETQPEQPRLPLSTGSKLTLLAAYLCAMGAIVWGLFALRGVAIGRLSTDEAARQWTDYRDEMAKQAKKGPVARRPPQSAEPPALIILRDYFAAVVAASLVFGTFLLAMLFVTLRSLWPASHTRAGSLHIGPQSSQGGPM
jgi:hypothetical protein